MPISNRIRETNRRASAQHVQQILHHRVGSGDHLGVRGIGLLGDDQFGEFVRDVGVGPFQRRADDGAGLAVQRLSGSVGHFERTAVDALEEVGAVEPENNSFVELLPVTLIIRQ